jgi:hypothetical protein
MASVGIIDGKGWRTINELIAGAAVGCHYRSGGSGACCDYHWRVRIAALKLVGRRYAAEQQRPEHQLLRASHLYEQAVIACGFGSPVDLQRSASYWEPCC